MDELLGPLHHLPERVDRILEDVRGVERPGYRSRRRATMRLCARPERPGAIRRRSP
jgi:hypothetical protein